MTKKYKVNEVAKDLQVENKEVIEVLKELGGEPKKATTALTEEELDIVFDHVTQKNSVENFDAYFAQKDSGESVEQPAEPKAEKEKPASKASTKTTQPAAQKSGDTPARKPAAAKNAKSAPAKAGTQQPAKAAQPASQPKQGNRPAQNSGNDNAVQKPAGRIVDTRASHVDIERYNEKYDRLASEKIKTDNVVQKQKLTQRSSQYRNKPKNSRKETEAERLRRIALERQKKQMTIVVPDEITVGELALRLKATAAEVIKKLMMMGVFATVNDVIDF